MGGDSFESDILLHLLNVQKLFRILANTSVIVQVITSVTVPCTCNLAYTFFTAGCVYGWRQPTRLVHLHVPLRASQGCSWFLDVVSVQPMVESLQRSLWDTAHIKENEVDWS